MAGVKDALRSALDALKTWKFWKELIIMTLGMLVGAAAVYYFLVPSKLIIGTISDMDLPLTPSARGSRSFSSYMGGVTEEDLQKIRDEVLDCTPEDIRKTSEYIREMMADNKLVVVGNEKLIRDNEKLVGKLENLL